MIIKRIHSQDAHYKFSPKKSGETSLNLSNDIFQLIAPELSRGDEKSVSFTLFRSDYLKALSVIINQSPLYVTSSTTATEVTSDPNVFIKDFQSICTFFGSNERNTYTVNLLYRSDGRIYLNSLEDKNSKFNIRHFLVEESSSLVFEKNGSDISIRLRFNLLDKNNNNKGADHINIESNDFTSNMLSYLTALRTKPFMLLAGISGTGKSRIVREMAKACWKEGDEEFGKNCPRNFRMVQVKPNWHDSSELIGYVSRLNGEKFVVGPFLHFLAAALKEPNVPYFLCLDEMNLAPVEQYFAEYLSVIESRKLNPDGTITTDPIIEYENSDAYGSLIDQLFDTPEERKAYKTDEGGKRLTIPQNLFVVGTVNMDETTFSFSLNVLYRAMTIEMNEVDLHGGLEKATGNEIGYIGNCIIGDAAEGSDVYEENKELCDEVLAYLEQVNDILEGTPFKIAYRTRNEFLMYAVNRRILAKESQLWQTLDEMTSMKILSRIEGDSDRTGKVLEDLQDLVKEQIESQIPPAEEGKPELKSISATKIKEMLDKLKASSFTSYWT